MTLVGRPTYLSWLDSWRDRDVIKVVTGVRRCGKSTLLRMWADHLRAAGVPDQRIHTINLEEAPNAPLRAGWEPLYQAIDQRVTSGGTNYVLIDEIQHVPEFERAAAALHVRPDIDLYLTGSSGHLMDGQLATLLSGRYVAIAMFPLSFREYLAATLGPDSLDGPTSIPLGASEAYRQYVIDGGFPGVLGLGGDPYLRDDYLSGIVDTVLLRDVAAARNLANVGALRRVADFLASNIGSLSSVRRIADAMTSHGRKISRDAVDNYIGGLLDAHLFYSAPRTDLRGEALLAGPEKLYIVDPVLRHVLVGEGGSDRGHILENIVYLELLRRRGRVSVGKVGSGEIDFVVRSSSGDHYYQVAESIADPAVLVRELAPLRAVRDFTARSVLTLDPGAGGAIDGIAIVNALEWLARPAEPARP
jgi:predicted AAA+ superfamily ATPase